MVVVVIGNECAPRIPDAPEQTAPWWLVPLGGLTPFARPVTSASLLPQLDQLMRVKEQLRVGARKPTYFPFIRYGDNQIRAYQGYLVKFAAELFDLIPGIES